MSTISNSTVEMNNQTPEVDDGAGKVLAIPECLEKPVQGQESEEFENSRLPATINQGSAEEVDIRAGPADCANLGVAPDRTVSHKQRCPPPSHQLLHS